MGHSSKTFDAIVVGAGPNGLAAAITLARGGKSVLVVEARESVGGGTRTAELTLPGFRHDVCSAIHPLGLASPFLKSLPLKEYGLEWTFAQAALAHPLDDGTAVIIEQSLEHTADRLGEDAPAYRKLFAPLVRSWKETLDDILAPLSLPPRHFSSFVNFGVRGFWPASWLARVLFRTVQARAVYAGLAAHAIMPLDKQFTSGFGLMLGMLAHSVGWPMARGGSQAISEAMSAYLQDLGGEVITGFQVNRLEDLPNHKVVLFDLSPRQMIEILGERLPAGYRRSLKKFRYGPGVFKLDLALDGPIPWKAQECAQAATVHIGGTLEEIAASESAVWRGEHARKPFVLLAQQSLFDDSRAPQGKHTVWAYCHVPNGSTQDMTEAIEAQVERFAPGFQERILARKRHTAMDMQAYNPNYVGGDINSGAQDWRQLFTRPLPRLVPYATPIRGTYLCSSSTPPGGGVHGMCGYYAAHAALRQNLL